MRLIDRLIFGFIAICLGILATRAIIDYPVQAAREEILKVNVVEISGQRIFRSDIIKR